MNRKLSSFESINAKDINKDLTYVSAVQKLSDGSYKNINIPLAQLSGLWNDDVKTAVANAEIDGASIDADVIHQAALNAVENALADAREAINNAINTANELAGDVATGNTAAQIALREAQEQINQAITEGQATVASMQTMYAQYFGDNGEVRQALNEANRDLSNAHALLTSAQNDLQALTNGEITPESLHEISNTVNGLKTMWGIQGTYVNDENTIANKVLDYVDIAIGKKNFEMTNINGETQQVTKFQDFVDCANGMYQKTLQNMNDAEDRVREIGEEWDVVKGEMSQYVKTSDFSDPNNSTLKSAVKRMTDSLISQTVRDVNLEVVETVRFPVNTNPGEVRRVQRALDKETYYYMSWDKADGDEVIPLNYQFKIKTSSSIPNYSDADWQELTLDGVNSPTVVQLDGNNEAIPDENDRYLYIQYNGAAQLTEAVDVKVCVQKYLTQSQLSQTAEGIVASAIRSLKNGGQLSNLTLTPETITATVANYLNSDEFKGTELGMTADRINATVLEYLKDGNNYRTLQSIIESTKDSINQSVADYSLELVEEFADDNSLDANHKITTTFSIDNSGNFSEKARVTANLEKGHTYFMKCVCIDTIYYKFGNAIQINSLGTLDNASQGWIKVTNPESIRLDISSDAASSVLTFFIKIKKDNNSQYLSGYSVQLFESVTSKMANFKITADQISEAITGQTGSNEDDLIRHIYKRVASQDGTNTVTGLVGNGFVTQSTLNSTADRLESEMHTIATGGNANNPFVLKSVFDQTIEKLETDVSRVEYLDIENIGNDTSSSEYDGISSGRANTYNSATLNGYNAFQKGPVFDLSPMSSTNWNGTIFCKLKVPNANTDYTLFLHSSDYRISELYFINTNTTNSNFKVAANCIYSESIEGSKLEPLHFGNNKIGFLAIVVKKAINDDTPAWADFNNKPLTAKFGIPNSVAVSNIKQTADGIKSQVSELQTTADGLGTTINTAVQNIVPGMISSTVASEVDGKLAGYSTIEQTKDFIASTVGAGGAVTNKFNDPLFKNEYSYWHKRYGSYPNYVDFIRLQTAQDGSIHKQFIHPSFIQYQLSSSNKFERDIKSFIMCDYNPSMISGLLETKRRHIYGMYTHPKITFGQKYTASFYIKLANGGYLNSMLNVGLCAELSKQASTFHIACIDQAWTLEQAENQTYDSNHDIKVGNLSSFLESDDLLSNPTGYRLEIENQGDTTGTGFDGSNADDNQFGVWLKFNKGYLGAYMTKIFGLSSPLTQSPTINGSTLKCRWFKIWFTFTPQDKYIGSDSNGHDIFINHTENSDRTFCFEPWVNQPAGNNFYPLFCEIAAPMLNIGTTPLKFSSQESISESYSTISQTNKSIEFSVNNAIDKLTGELNNAGIKLDGENSRIEFNARTSAFTGAVNAESFKVTPKNSDSSIELVIYNSQKPEHAILNNQGFTDGVPLLLARCGTDMYVINLTKLTGNNGTYWKIDTDHPIRERVLYTGNPSNNYVFGLSNEITFYQFIDNSVNIYSHKFICESEIELKIIGTIIYSGISSNKYFTQFNYNNSPQSVTIPLKGNKTKTIAFKDKGCNPDLSDVITDEPVESTKPFTYSLPTVNYGSYNTPVVELGSFTGNPLYRISANNPYFIIDNKTKCGITNIGTYRKCRVYRRMDNGVLVDFPEERYCFIVEKNNTKRFVGFCGYNEILRRYNAYIDSQNPYSGSYGYQNDRQRELGEYFVKDGLYEVSLDNRVSQDGYNSLEACSISNCKILFTKSEITKFEEVLNRGVSAALANDYFRIVD